MNTWVLGELWSFATKSEVPGPATGLTWNLSELRILRVAPAPGIRACTFTRPPVTHDTGKVARHCLEPPGGQSLRNTYVFYMLGHHAWAQAKVGSLACKKFEKLFLSLPSPHCIEDFVKAEKGQKTCSESEAASQSRRKARILKGFVTLA